MTNALRLGACLLLLAGAAAVVLSLVLPWAVDGPHEGRRAVLDGRDVMAWGDVLLGALALVASVLALGTSVRSRGSMSFTVAAWGAAGVCLVTLLGLIWFRVWFDFAIVMDPDDLPRYRAGDGQMVAIGGLVSLFVGTIAVAVWNLRTMGERRLD